MTDTEKLLASCYEPSVAAHWDGDVLVLTTTRDPSSIHVQQGDGQQRKVYTGEPVLFAPPIKDNWQGALCKRIDELCAEVERLKGENAKLRERAVAELSELRGVVSEGDYDSPSGRYFLLRRDVAAYEDALREVLGIEGDDA